MQLTSPLKFNLLKAAFVVIALYVFSLTGFCQSKKHGSIQTLSTANGFKGIVLGSDISDLMSRYKLSFMDENSSKDADSCITYACTDSTLLAMPNNLNLDVVGIRTYNHKIINIILFFNKKDSYKILDDFLKQYGQFTNLPYEYTDIYEWNTSNVDLSLKYAANVDYGIAVFTSSPLLAQINHQKQVQQEMVAQSRESYLASRGVYAKTKAE